MAVIGLPGNASGGRYKVTIHPLAVVSSEAQLGRDISVEQFCVIEAGARIGDGCRLESHVIIKRNTVLGANNHIFEGAVIGSLPQHIKVPAHTGGVMIGSGNTLREHVTVHRALHEGQMTTLGDNSLLMVGSHVAHDCHLGNHVILANNAMLAGHVEVQDRAYISGAVGIHQFCRVGTFAMVGGHARVLQDVPPYVTIDGGTGCVVGLNTIGLRRNGFTAEQIAELKAAYRALYRSGLRLSDIMARLKQEFPTGPAAKFHEFLSGGTRGFVRERRVPSAPATIKLPETQETAAEFKAKAG